MRRTLKNTSGKIDIDNNDINYISDDWIENIGYVPQSLQLIDDTILNNIALSNEIKLDEIKEAAKNAEILKYINSESKGFIISNT